MLHLRADGYQFIPVDTSPVIFESFKYFREVFRWGRDIESHVLGNPVEPAVKVDG